MGDAAHDIKTFLMRIHGNYEGWAYTARMEGEEARPSPYQTPKRRQQFSIAIAAYSRQSTSYYSPALYQSKEGLNQRTNFKQSKFLWIDIDHGKGPEALKNLNGLPKPSIVVQTSPAGNYHIYWELDSPCDDADIVERANKGIAKAIGIGDFSTWDAGQLLRIPGTWNLKHAVPFQVKILEDNKDRTYDISAFPLDFESLDRNIEVELQIDFAEIPNPDVVLKQYNIPETTLAVYKTTYPENRSDALYRIGLDLIEYVANIRDDEVYSLLENRDNFWGKYVDEKSPDRQRKELCRIILKGRQKHQLQYEKTTRGFPSRSIRELQVLHRSRPVFIFGNFIPYKSLVLLFGQPGIGKTHFALDMAAHAIAGVGFLEFPYNEHIEINPYYITMEMNDNNVTQYLTSIASNFTDEQHNKVMEQFHGAALQSSTDLWESSAQQNLKYSIEDNNHNLIIIDSIASSGGDGDHTREYYDFMNDVLIRDLKCTVVLIGHDRKPSQDTPRKQLDINDAFGSRIHTARPDTIISMEKVKNTPNYRVDSLKTRHGAEFGSFIMNHTAPSTFVRIEEEDESTQKKEVKKDDGGAVTRFKA